MFTDHTIKHSDGVLAILDWLLLDEAKDQLNAWELYFLVAATYLHDIGMVEGCPGSPSGPEWESHYNATLEKDQACGANDPSGTLLKAKREFVRAHHHERSSTYIAQNWTGLELRASDTLAEGQIIARLALGHRKVNLGDRSLYGEIPFGNNQLVRRDLLAAYLRLADELDTTALRTPWVEYEILDINDETAALEWAKHLSISGVASSEGVIVLSGVCHDHSVYLRIVQMQKEIKAKLDEMKRMLNRPYATGDGFMLADPLPYHDIELRLEHQGYLPINIKFELEHEHIARLIMGERLYGDGSACVRELLQNAVDSCREAREVKPSGWRADIEVTVEDDGKVLSISDNGVGMDEYIIRAYFARVGLSYYQSQDFKGQFRPISEFGIGILSCFMLSDTIEVDTRKEGCKPIRILIRNMTESFVPNEGTRTESGTTVRLRMKPGFKLPHEIIHRLVRHYCRHVEFQIRVSQNGMLSETVADDGLVPYVYDIAHLDGYSVYESNLETINLKGMAHTHTTLRKDGLELGVTLAEGFWSADRIRRSAKHGTGGKVSQQGFYIREIKDEVQEFGQRAWVELNLTGEASIDLTVDRTRFARVNKELWTKVTELYSDCVEGLFESSVASGNSADWWRFHDDHYARFIGLMPASFRASAQTNATFCTMTVDGFQPRSFTDIRNWPGRVYWAPEGPHSQIERVRGLIPDDALVLVAFGVAGGGFSGSAEQLRIGILLPGWAHSLFEGQTIGSYQSFFDDLGIKVVPFDINGKPTWFMDAGNALGRWRMGPGFQSPESRGFGHNVHDLNHPFSQLLINWCTGNLPRASSLVVEDLLRPGGWHRYHDTEEELSTEELGRRQMEVVNALKSDKVIPVDFELAIVEESEVAQHECVYGGDSASGTG
jgi:hypothetical protein